MILIQISAHVRRRDDAERVGRRLAEVVAAKAACPVSWVTARTASAGRARGGRARIELRLDRPLDRDEVSAIVKATGSEIDSDRNLVDSLVEFLVQADGPAPDGGHPIRSFSTYDYKGGFREERLAELAEAAR